MASFLRVRNLGKYQHYRDRNPPWVKLHRDLLEDYDFEQLPDATKAHAILLLLLAARLGNEIPNDPDWIARKIGARSKVEVAKLLESRFLESCGAECSQLASKALASCDTSATVEGEGEKRESRGKGRGEESLRGADAPLLASPALLTFNVQGKTDKWSLTQRQVDEWQQLYPALDVIACCRKAFAWAEANPAKRKTAKGMPAFLVNWLNKEANSGRSSSAVRKTPDCDRCAGKGYAEIPIPGGAVFDPELGRSRSTFSREPCKRCQGTGKF